MIFQREYCVREFWTLEIKFGKIAGEAGEIWHFKFCAFGWGVFFFSEKAQKVWWLSLLPCSFAALFQASFSCTKLLHVFNSFDFKQTLQRFSESRQEQNNSTVGSSSCSAFPEVRCRSKKTKKNQSPNSRQLIHLVGQKRERGGWGGWRVQTIYVSSSRFLQTNLWRLSTVWEDIKYHNFIWLRQADR